VTNEQGLGVHPAAHGSQRAVFISYASQDAEAAARICESLRAAGMEVWYDKSELRGGDAWDAAIKQQIKACALFVPIISSNSQTRTEGYFRLEWKLAVDRSHQMAHDRAFLMPVVIDETRDADARVPDKFREVQWTHLPDGATSTAFTERVLRLLSSAEPVAPAPAREATSAGRGAAKSLAGHRGAFWRSRPALIIAAGVIAVGYSLVERFVLSKRLAESARASAPTVQTNAAVQAAIPDKSIAVLPFADLSEKHDQEYFSDGLSEELIEQLTKVRDLHVPGRTSSFYFKGKSEDIATIAQKLRVAHVLEGSVRKSGHTVRVNAQLIQADSGYDVWSQTYDRDLKDIFQVQDEIAGAVVQALKATLLASTTRGDRTANVDAFSLLLQGRFLYQRQTEVDVRQAVQVLQRAVTLDPSYAPAWAELSEAHRFLSVNVDVTPEQDMEPARAAAQRALELDPANAAGHIALADLEASYDHDWKRAAAEIEAAHRADPKFTTPSRLAFVSGCNAAPCYDRLIQDMSATIERDPLNAGAYRSRGYIRYVAGRLEAAESDARRALELSPSLTGGHYVLTLILIARHKFADLLAVASADAGPGHRAGLALAYQALGRRAEADAALQDMVTQDARNWAYQIAQVYASRGDAASALDWLERAHREHQGGLNYLAVDPLFKPLAHEPRYTALIHQLGLAD
jgi:TolB-like protein